MKSLTKRQKEILEFIKEKVKQKGYPPTIREICIGVNLTSSSSVHEQLKKIEEKGFIRIERKEKRALQVLNKEFNDLKQSNTKEIPVIKNLKEYEEFKNGNKIIEKFPFKIPKGNNNTFFVLKVSEQELKVPSINKGDYLIIEESEQTEGNIFFNKTKESIYLSTKKNLNTIGKATNVLRIF